MPALCCTQQETSKRGVSRAHCRPGPEPGRFVEPAVRSPAISERRSGGLGRLWCGLLSLARSRLSGVAYSGATAWQSSKAAPGSECRQRSWVLSYSPEIFFFFFFQGARRSVWSATLKAHQS